MNNDDDNIRSQLASLLEFTGYLAGSIEANTEIDPETRNELRTLLPVLKAYGSELERRLEARPATPIYFRLLMLALLDAVRIRHYLVTTFPRLAAYRPADTPTDVPQETMKHGLMRTRRSRVLLPITGRAYRSTAGLL